MAAFGAIAAGHRSLLLRRRYLTTHLAAGIGSSVQIDVPLASQQIGSLRRCEGG